MHTSESQVWTVMSGRLDEVLIQLRVSIGEDKESVLVDVSVLITEEGEGDVKNVSKGNI